MTNLLGDGGRVMTQDVGSVLIVLACMAWGAIVTIAALRVSDDEDRTPSDYFSLALGGWLVAVFLIAVPIFLVGALLGLRPTLAAAGISLAGSAVFLGAVLHRPPRKLDAAGILSVLGLVGLFVAFIWIRLAFMSRITLPQYFDSAEHYRIIQALMQAYGEGVPSRAPTWPVSTYYHLGFHLILSVLAFLSTQNLAALILAAGQMVLAAIPIGLFAIVRRETRSTAAGFLAVVLGGVGWYVPAFVLNWGKYPAVFSLPPILFCLAAGQLAGGSDGRHRNALLLLSGCAAGAAFLIQTRSVILVGIALGSWWFAGRWLSRPEGQRRATLGLMLLVLGLEAFVIARDPILSPVLDPYIGSGLSVTLVVALLGCVGFRKHPGLAFAGLTAIMLLWLGLYLPVPGFGSSPLLDRPLVETVLFVPLVMLAAAGLATAMEYFADVAGLVKTAGIAMLCAAILAHALVNYSFYPSDCCTLVRDDDLVALDWIGRNLPATAKVAIPYADLQAAPAPYPPLSPNTDAGVWITPLTGRATASLPYATDFAQASTLANLCSIGVSEVYVGAMSQSFRSGSMENEPLWYALQLSLPGVRLYRVIGCTT